MSCTHTIFNQIFFQFSFKGPNGVYFCDLIEYQFMMGHASITSAFYHFSAIISLRGPNKDPKNFFRINSLEHYFGNETNLNSWIYTCHYGVIITVTASTRMRFLTQGSKFHHKAVVCFDSHAIRTRRGFACVTFPVNRSFNFSICFHKRHVHLSDVI